MQKFHNKIIFLNLDNGKTKYKKPIFIIGLPRQDLL